MRCEELIQIPTAETRMCGFKNIDFDYMVTVCGYANENSPFFPGKAKVVHAGFDDPPKLAEQCHSEEEKLNCYRRVRDEIRTFVEKTPNIFQAKQIR